MTKTRLALLITAGFVAGVVTTLALQFVFLTSFAFRQARRAPLLVTDEFTRAEMELKSAKDEYSRWIALTDHALVSVDRLPNPEVRKNANEVLLLAEKYRKDWNYGNAVHKANLALGRIALREGNVSAAKDFLRQAGRTPGSPQLDSFGPNMILAKELFERGEREILLEYFALCGRFWSTDFGKLRDWTNQVKDGAEPDFGANLDY